MRPTGIAIALAVTLAALLGASASFAQGASNVEVQALPSPDLAFAPDSVTIGAGGSVQFVNVGGFHTVTSSDSRADGERRANGVFDETLSGEGATVTWTIDQPGTYYYFCQPHSGVGMAGTIVVTDDPVASGNGDGATGDKGAPGPAVGLALAALLGVLLWVRQRR